MNNPIATKEEMKKEVYKFFVACWSGEKARQEGLEKINQWIKNILQKIAQRSQEINNSYKKITMQRLKIMRNEIIEKHTEMATNAYQLQEKINKNSNLFAEEDKLYRETKEWMVTLEEENRDNIQILLEIASIESEIENSRFQMQELVRSLFG